MRERPALGGEVRCLVIGSPPLLDVVVVINVFTLMGTRILVLSRNLRAGRQREDGAAEVVSLRRLGDLQRGGRRIGIIGREQRTLIEGVITGTRVGREEEEGKEEARRGHMAPGGKGKEVMGEAGIITGTIVRVGILLLMGDG